MAAAATSAAPGQTSKIPLSGAVTGPPSLEDFNPFLGGQHETFKERLTRKTKQNPFVPIGCLATVGALTFGLRAFLHGNSKQSQIMMRGRIAAQGFTLAAIVFGVLATTLKSKA